MTGISDTFTELRERGEGALISYLTVGYPHVKQTPRLVKALIEGGSDIIELGVPFSDPIADGPTIQNAVTRSLASGARPLDSLEVARSIKERYDTPLVLMTYFNPIFRVGLPKFLQQAKSSGISGIIVPDLPVEESGDYKKNCEAAGVDTIFLASPSTSPDRIKEIINQSSGYLYLVSLYGVTGTRSTMAAPALELIKKYSETLPDTLPLAVGFGISKPDHVRQVISAGGDGAVVGSAFVEIIEQNSRRIPQAAEKLKKLARAMKKATLQRK